MRSASDDALYDLDRLIYRLNSTPLLSAEEKKARRDARRVDFLSNPTPEQIAAHVKAFSPKAFSGSHWKRLDSIQNDLAAQVKIVSDMLDDWFRLAEPVAPAYAWRIAVILRNENLKGLEVRFLNAYTRHFENRVNTRDRQLAERRDRLRQELGVT